MTDSPRKLVVAFDYFGTLSAFSFEDRQKLFDGIQKLLFGSTASILVLADIAHKLDLGCESSPGRCASPAEYMKLHPQLSGLISYIPHGVNHLSLSLDTSLFGEGIEGPNHFRRLHENPAILMVDDFPQAGSTKRDRLADWLGGRKSEFEGADLIHFEKHQPTHLLRIIAEYVNAPFRRRELV